MAKKKDSKEKLINEIICGDTLDVLKRMPDDFVSLIFTSPPYNLKIDYGEYEDDMPWSDFMDWLKKIWIECKRVLRPGGRLAINMATITNRQSDKDKEYFRFIGKYLSNQMDEVGLLPFGEIVWYKQDAAGKKTAWGSWCSCSCPIIRSTHEYIYVFSKDKFSLDGDIEQCDLEPEEFNDWTFSTWFISPETRNMGGHPVPFPEELVKRAVKLWTYRGDTVLDPFCGSGTTTYVSMLLDRNYIGIDLDPEYVKYAKGRIEVSRDIFADQKTYVPRSVRLKHRKELKQKATEETEQEQCFD